MRVQVPTVAGNVVGAPPSLQNALGDTNTTNDDCNTWCHLTESNGYAPSDPRRASSGGREEGIWREEANEAAGRGQRSVQDSQARNGPQPGPCNHFQLRQEVSVVHCMRPRRVNGSLALG